jgi:hypothetical protein
MCFSAYLMVSNRIKLSRWTECGILPDGQSLKLVRSLMISVLCSIACFASARAAEPEPDPARILPRGGTVAFATYLDVPRVVEVDLSEVLTIDRGLFPKLVAFPELRRLFIGCMIDDDARSNVRWASTTQLRSQGSPRPFTDDDVAALACLKQLELLDLSGTAVTDAGVAPLASMRYLTCLGLGWTTVTGKGLVALKELPDLHTIDLRLAPLDKEGVDAISQLSRLRVLMISGKTINDDLVALLPEKLPHLRELRLKRSNSTAIALRNLAAFQELEELRLEMHNTITAIDLKPVTGMKSVSKLSLYWTPVADDVVEQLISMERLEYVNLLYTNVTQEGITLLRAKRPKLEVEWNPAARFSELRPPN